MSVDASNHQNIFCEHFNAARAFLEVRHFLFCTLSGVKVTMISRHTILLPLHLDLPTPGPTRRSHSEPGLSRTRCHVEPAQLLRTISSLSR